MSAAKDLARKRKNYTMGDYTPTENQQKAMVWCTNQHIHMWPKKKKEKEWWVEIRIGHNTPNRSPEAYGPVEIWKRIYEYYEHYYDKRNQ